MQILSVHILYEILWHSDCMHRRVCVHARTEMRPVDELTWDSIM